MKLIITRHGETEENVAGILMGHLPGVLSTNGINQAKKLALRLKDEKINFIYSSDLTRASDTAKEIAKYHKNTPIEFTKELREKNLGEFEGKKKSDLGWDNNNFMATSVEPQNGESLENLYLRAKNFLSNTFKKHDKNTILLVAHNGINKAIVSVITKVGIENIKTAENFKNTSLSVFDIDKNKNYKMILFNDTKHLE